MSAIDQALLAVLTADGGDTDTAAALLTQARHQSRTTARRERQVVEIAALAVAGEKSRAGGLAREHTREFPNDVELLARLTPPDG